MTIKITLSARMVLGLLLVVWCALTVVNAVILWYCTVGGMPEILKVPVVRLFDFDSETNIPTWFSSVMLLFASFLLAVVYFRQKAAGKRSKEWMEFSWLLAFLSLDEAAMMHEIVSESLLYAFHFKGFLFYPWVIVAIGACSLFTVVFWPVLRTIPSRTSRLILFGIATYIVGAVGMEIIAAHLVWSHYAKEYICIESFVEEMLEIGGTILFIYALLDFLEREEPVSLFPRTKKRR